MCLLHSALSCHTAPVRHNIVGSKTKTKSEAGNICDNLSPYFYRAVMPQCPSVCPSVTFRRRDYIGWNTSKITSPPNSDKIVMWRFLRNRRLILRLGYIQFSGHSHSVRIARSPFPLDR